MTEMNENAPEFFAVELTADEIAIIRASVQVTFEDALNAAMRGDLDALDLLEPIASTFLKVMAGASL